MKIKKLLKFITKNEIDINIAVYALTALYTTKGRKFERKLRQFLEFAADKKHDFEKIREACLQTYLFAGFPKTLNALMTIAEVAAQFNIPLRTKLSEPEKLYVERGKELFKKVYRNNTEKLLEKTNIVSPELSRWMIVEGYGKTLSRIELDIKTRELCIIAAISVIDTPTQLYSHIKGALNVGVTDQELLQFVNFLSYFLNKHERNQLISTFTSITSKSSNNTD